MYYLLKEYFDKDYNVILKKLYNMRNATAGYRKSSKYDKLLEQSRCKSLECNIEKFMQELTALFKEIKEYIKSLKISKYKVGK